MGPLPNGHEHEHEIINGGDPNYLQVLGWSSKQLVPSSPVFEKSTDRDPTNKLGAESWKWWFPKESPFSSGYMFICHFQDPESKQSRFHGSANRLRKRFWFHGSLWKINHVMSYPATDLQFSPNYFMKNTWNQFSKMLVWLRGDQNPRYLLSLYYIPR